MTAKLQEFIYYAKDKFPSGGRKCIDKTELVMAINEVDYHRKIHIDENTFTNGYNQAKDDILHLLGTKLEYFAICDDCGKLEYPRVDKSKWLGITVHAGICPICHKQKTLIPVSDWEGHGD